MPAVAGGGDVAQPVEAGHALLDDLRHGVFERLGRGARIRGADVDRRRGDVGYCAIGRRRIDSAPASMITSAITHAKIGRSMKKRQMRLLRDRGGAFSAPPWQARRRRRRGAGAAPMRPGPRPRRAALTACTTAPGRARCRPSTITRSPAWPRRRASRCRRALGLQRAFSTLPAPTTSRSRRPCVARTPCCGTRIAFSRTPLRAARTYMPGSRMPSGFGKSARSVMAPVVGSTVTRRTAACPRRYGCRPRTPAPRARSFRRVTSPLAIARRRRSTSALDCVTSTKIGSSRWIVVRASAGWPRRAHRA